jgi:hypothetical protein
LDKDLKLSIRDATEEVAKLIENDGTTWKFIPPATPHLGGIWEAGVKSMKTHLTSKLTFEEFSTVLSRIEACLNSRPITPISSIPTDLKSLTLGQPSTRNSKKENNRRH